MDGDGVIQIFLLLFIATRDHIQCSGMDVIELPSWQDYSLLHGRMLLACCLGRCM